jgi:hypothetical protein
VQLPLWVIVSFGAYSLAVISYNLIKFRDCPEAAAELEKVRRTVCACVFSRLLMRACRRWLRLANRSKPGG